VGVGIGWLPEALALGLVVAAVGDVGLALGADPGAVAAAVDADVGVGAVGGSALTGVAVADGVAVPDGVGRAVADALGDGVALPRAGDGAGRGRVPAGPIGVTV
jgi:hypothetical protein